MPYLSLNNVSKNYETGDGNTPVLHNINLEIAEGEFVAIVGFTGSGKTTLISLIAGLILPTNGSILLNEKPLPGASLGKGLIFQHYSLLPWLNVLENVMFAVDEIFPDLSVKQRKERALLFIEKVKLTDAIYKRPSELSGGMKQRVAVARTLVGDPEILLMDEPLSALDALTRSKLQDEILGIWQENRKTALLITNNVDEAIIMADRIIPLLPGPNASLGESFIVPFSKEPGFKKNISKDKRFTDIRNSITSYLVKAKDK